MSATVNIAELNSETRARVLKQIDSVEGTAVPAVASAEGQGSLTLGEPVGVHLTKSGLTFSRDISIDEWVGLGQKLKKIEGSIQWWIGDWLNYGEKVYGEKYTKVLHVFDYKEKSLRNMSSVSKRVEMSRRRDNLSYGHHAEVAALEPEQQIKLLDWAAKEKVSVKELRTKIKQKNQPARGGSDLTAQPESEESPLTKAYEAISPFYGEGAGCPFNAIPDALSWVNENQPLNATENEIALALVNMLGQISGLTAQYCGELKNILHSKTEGAA